ncbi:MAG: hypothetical protein EBY32_17960 [Proteobacteria bacterium]|nr:hypothetical protein [Pseudomonadota bacterium]
MRGPFLFTILPFCFTNPSVLPKIFLKSFFHEITRFAKDFFKIFKMEAFFLLSGKVNTHIQHVDDC